MVGRHLGKPRHGPLHLRPSPGSEHLVGDSTPEHGRAEVVVLEPDRPRAGVSCEYVDRQEPPDTTAARDRSDPEPDHRAPLTFKTVYEGEPDRCVFAGLGVRSPSQIPDSVRRREPRQWPCLVATVRVRQPLHDARQIVTEQLPQPGDDLPLVRCDGTNTDTTRSAHTSRSKHAGNPTPPIGAATGTPRPPREGTRSRSQSRLFRPAPRCRCRAGAGSELGLLIGGRWVRLPGVAAHLGAPTESGWLSSRGSRLCSGVPSAGDRVRVSMGRYAGSSARTKETG